MIKNPVVVTAGSRTSVRMDREMRRLQKRKARLERKMKGIINRRPKEKDLPREIKFFDCMSKIVVTDRFTREYMDVLLKYKDDINARLVQKAG